MNVEQRVICPYCRFIQRIEIPADEYLFPKRGWALEAECPSCETVTTFTRLHTPEAEVNKKPVSREPSEEWQEETSILFKPIREQAEHPALRWFVSVGNMWISDDCSPCPFSTTWVIYQFRWGRRYAYVWQQDDKWFVRPWCHKSGLKQVPAVVEVPSFSVALDQLTDPPSEAGSR
jgi:hypothetical protein